MNEILIISNEIEKFRNERDWKKFHDEKNLAISISLEASELLELFQWKSSENVIDESMDKIKEELADVFIYSFMMANNLNIDISKIIYDKLAINKGKYPIEKSKGSNKKYTEFQ